MQLRNRTHWIVFASALAFSTLTGIAQTPIPNPWLSSSWPPPPGYHGPLFKLSYNYPERLPPVQANPPWIRALASKPISADNALAYVQAVKDYLADDMRSLIMDYEHWDARQRKWYNLPWMFSIQDPIRGTYVGTQFDPTIFLLSNMKKKQMTDYVVVYYNEVAGYTLGKLWGKSALKPNLNAAQFQDGAIIIKVASTDALANDWSPMEGAETWELYPPVIDGNGNATSPTKTVKVAVLQFDIIVKDTKTAPKTGWVFATLVYDKNVQGDAWTRLVPLGAMWGNDPDNNSTVTPNEALTESIVNPMAPLYSVETLGYGGRLSGPNDGAISENNIVGGELIPRARISSCMSCHGVAEWPLKSSLVPASNGNLQNPPDPDNLYSYIPRPGSIYFNNWFQDRPGRLAQDEGAIALDYDMNITLKALPFWQKYTSPSPAAGAAVLTQIPRGLHRQLLQPETTTQTGRRIR